MSKVSQPQSEPSSALYCQMHSADDVAILDGWRHTARRCTRRVRITHRGTRGHPL